MEIKYAEMLVSNTWGPTDSLRQIVDSVQGLIGVQRLWRCRETGETEWKNLPSVTAQEVYGYQQKENKE